MRMVNTIWDTDQNWRTVRKICSVTDYNTYMTWVDSHIILSSEKQWNKRTVLCLSATHSEYTGHKILEVNWNIMNAFLKQQDNEQQCRQRVKDVTAQRRKQRPAWIFPEHFLMTPNNIQCWQPLSQRQRSNLKILEEHILPIKDRKTTFTPFAGWFWKLWDTSQIQDTLVSTHTKFNI